MYILVAGGGTVGYALTKQLLSQGHEVALVEMDRARAQQMAGELGSVVIAERADEGRWLVEAGVERADVVVAVTSDDEDNLIICQMAQLIAQRAGRGRPRTIARVKDPQYEEVFQQLGIDAVVSTTPVITAMIEQALSPHPVVHLLTLRRAGIELMEFVLPADAPAIGRSPDDLRLPPGARVALITRNGQTLAPSPSITLAQDDVLIMLVPVAQEATVRDHILGPVG